MMRIKKAVFLFILIGSGLAGYSQKKDFGIWYGVAAEHKLADKLELDLSGVLRTFKDASKIEEFFLEAGLTYKFNDYFSAGASYRITENIEDDDAFHIRHKWFVDAKGTLPAGDLTVTARARFQQRYKTYFEDEEDKIPDSHVRTRLKVHYDIPNFKINPYLAAELFLPAFADVEKTVDKYRLSIGADYSFAKKHTVELEYIFQRDYLPKLSDINLISLQYNFKF
ncbi:MAG: DUF2490 domain-containing protein [Bacteroidales bacterium]